MIILCSSSVDAWLDEIYTDKSIAFVGNSFSQAFTGWNEQFCEDVTVAINSLMTIHTGTTCTLQIRYFAIPNNIVAIIIRCDIDIPFLREVERQSNAERIQRGFRSVPPTTFSSMPPVNVAMSPRFRWYTPKGKSFAIPPKMRILKGEYYNGMKVGYYKRKYTILNAEGKPITNKWFDKRPHFFNKPFGQYRIIAHVNYRGSLFAVSVEGQLYNMNKLWDDAYLKEIYEAIIKSLITETINSYLRNNLLIAS